MLIPSIDLQGGRVVQLVQGETLALATDDLDHWIERFKRFSTVQVIDLDAARRTGSNAELVRYVCRRLPCQVGGGVRSVEDATSLLDAGARRVIVGSVLFDKSRGEPDTAGAVNVRAAEDLSTAIGADRLIAAIDSRGGRVAVDGWKTTLELPAVEAIRPLERWVGGFLATLIDGEGRMEGLDLDAAMALRRATSRRLIVAGGVRDTAEVDALHALGMDAVVGMAIYTGRLSLESPGAHS
jgi:phosphoribosylformimino-5-aminoimidazole carboxamide ribotide isomerase